VDDDDSDDEFEDKDDEEFNNSIRQMQGMRKAMAIQQKQSDEDKQTSALATSKKSNNMSKREWALKRKAEDYFQKRYSIAPSQVCLWCTNNDVGLECEQYISIYIHRIRSHVCVLNVYEPSTVLLLAGDAICLWGQPSVVFSACPLHGLQQRQRAPLPRLQHSQGLRVASHAGIDQLCGRCSAGGGWRQGAPSHSFRSQQRVRFWSCYCLVLSE
jgi:hypothetical protein